jgi:hypothetical protein
MKRETIPRGAHSYHHAGLWPLSLDELVAYETLPATREKRQRRSLPYGMWTCANGRELLFNRSYRPIWQRLRGGVVYKADPGEWVPFTEERFLFSDWDAPWSRACGRKVLYETRHRVDRALVDFLCGESMKPDDERRWCIIRIRRHD